MFKKCDGFEETVFNVSILVVLLLFFLTIACTLKSILNEKNVLIFVEIVNG